MIVFVKPHDHYNSYTDFWNLVELSGFNQCRQLDLKSKNTYIVPAIYPDKNPINFPWKLSWWQRKKKSARLILWDLERPGPRGGLKANKRFLNRCYFDEIWHSDRQLSKEMDSRFVVLGSDRRLGTRPAFFKRYNFVHMSYMVERRVNILGNLERVGTNGWGKHRHDVLRKARFGLNIHQDNDLYIEPLRMALFAAYQLPIISETVYDSFPISLLTANYDQLEEFCRLCIKDYLRLKELGKEIQYILCEKYNFNKVVRNTVKN